MNNETEVKIPFTFKKDEIREEILVKKELFDRLDISLVDAFVKHMKENPEMVTSDISTDQVTLGLWKNRKVYKTTTLKITIKELVNN